MADISKLGGLQPVEQLDIDETYKDATSSPSIPKKGRYTVQAPDHFPSEAFGRSGSGALSIQVDPRIIGPTNEGYTLRYVKVSGKVFKRGGVNVSQIGDYLRATGFRGKLSDEQAQADAVEATANSVYEIDLDWKAYNKVTKFSVEGMEKFPSDGAGGHLPYIEDPNDFEVDEFGGVVTDAQGAKVHKRLPARAYVARFVPAS